MRLFLDVTRLRQRRRRTTPSDVDRTEYAYLAAQAKRLETHFVVFKRTFAGLKRPGRALELRGHVDAALSERILFSPRDILQARTRLGRRARGSLEGKSRIYLRTSSAPFDKPGVSHWLGSADVGPAFFLHDVISIDYSGLGRPGERGTRRARLRAIANHARLAPAISGHPTLSRSEHVESALKLARASKRSAGRPR